MHKKILLTGVNGQVGHALNRAFLMCSQSLYQVVGLDRNQLNLSDQAAIRRVVQALKPDLIINPAAYTAVDQAESAPEIAYAINAEAPRVLAEEAASIGAKLIHFSTDYVYAGNKAGAYYEDDVTQPLSVYGKSKLAGEEAIRAVGLQHLVFRTSWVYGAYGKNFLHTILRLAKARDALRVVADQKGAPTSSTSIADAVLDVLDAWQSETGIYHLVNAGETSWHGFAVAIIEAYTALSASKGWPALKITAEQVTPISTAEYPTPAVRPANSCLDCSKLRYNFSIAMPDWHLALMNEMLDMP
ncbi:MAG: dTDP-4-dehydrorhamnose reductase [Methylotenera sp.]|nr:dTDP-4-dehydrorhamnose reductase [Methylotenera sp.]